MKTRILIALILVVALGVAAAVFLQTRGQYLLISPKRGPVVEAVYGIGTVTAKNSYQVKVGVTAALRKTFVRQGDKVSKGQALVEMEDAGVLKSPIDGVITSMPYNTGEIAFPQTPIMTITDLSDRYLVVSLEQTGALRVGVGQKAVLGFESLRGEKFEGTVTHIYPNEGQFFVHIVVQDLNPQILPGMTADVAIQVGRTDNALLIPVAGLSGGKLTILRDGHKTKVDVKVGSIDLDWAEVISGDVQTTDKVVVKQR